MNKRLSSVTTLGSVSADLLWRERSQISTLGSVNPFFPSFTRTGFSVLVCQTSIWWEKKQHGDKQAGTLVTCRSLNAPIQSAPRSAPTPPHLLQKHSISLIAPAPPPMCKELLECEPCIRREWQETTGVLYLTNMMKPSEFSLCKRVLSLPWG